MKLVNPVVAASTVGAQLAPRLSSLEGTTTSRAWCAVGITRPECSAVTSGEPSTCATRSSSPTAIEAVARRAVCSTNS